MNKKFIVRLTSAEREQLEGLVSKGKAAAYKIKHGNILLTVDASGPNWSDADTAAALGCHGNTVRNVRQRFVEQGLESALDRKKQDSPSRSKTLDGKKEAQLIAIACGRAPEGRARWTMQLLADELVTLEIVDSISASTVCRTPKKTNFNRTGGSAG